MCLSLREGGGAGAGRCLRSPVEQETGVVGATVPVMLRDPGLYRGRSFPSSRLRATCR